MRIIENRKLFFGISFALIAVGIAIMIVNYSRNIAILNFDTEFVSGSSLYFDVGTEFNIVDIQKLLRDATGQESPQVQPISGTNEILIKLQQITPEQKNAILDAFRTRYGTDNSSLLQSSEITEIFSKETQNAILMSAVLVCVLILIYVSVRLMDFTAGIAVAVSMLHEIFLIITVYAIFGIPINESFAAAVVMMMGYSAHSIIIVFSKVRENKLKNGDLSNAEVINLSVAQSIKQLIIVSGTMLFVFLSAYILAAQAVKEFALPLIIGVVASMYSSVCLSGSIWYIFMNGKKSKKVKAVE